MRARTVGEFALLLVMLPGGAIGAESVVAPFFGHYTADWKSINVGTSDLELKPDTSIPISRTTAGRVQTASIRVQAIDYGTQEITLAVENHHRMVAAVEDVNIVLFVDADRPDLTHDHAGGNMRPIIELFITVVTFTDCYGHSVPLVAVPASACIARPIRLPVCAA